MAKAKLTQEEKLNAAIASMVMGSGEKPKGLQYEKFLAAAGELSVDQLMDVIKWVKPSYKSWSKIMPHLEAKGVSLEAKLRMCGNWVGLGALRYTTDKKLLDEAVRLGEIPRKYDDQFAGFSHSRTTVFNLVLKNEHTAPETRARFLGYGDHAAVRLVHTREHAIKLGCWDNEFKHLRDEGGPQVTYALDSDGLLSEDERRVIAQNHKSRKYAPLRDEGIKEEWFAEKERAEPLTCRKTRVFAKSIARGWKLTEAEIRALVNGKHEKDLRYYGNAVEDLMENPHIKGNPTLRAAIVDEADRCAQVTWEKDERSYGMWQVEAWVKALQNSPDAKDFVVKWAKRVKRPS